MNPNRVWHRMQFLQNVTPNKVKGKKNRNKELHLIDPYVCSYPSSVRTNLTGKLGPRGPAELGADKHMPCSVRLFWLHLSP